MGNVVFDPSMRKAVEKLPYLEIFMLLSEKDIYVVRKTWTKKKEKEKEKKKLDNMQMRA